MSDIFIYPTDTVWGIGGDIFDKKTYLEIAKIKGTDTSKPLSILFYSVEHLLEHFEIDKVFKKEWLEIFFSLEATLGVPLTLAKTEIPKHVSCGSSFVCLRVLKDEILREIIQKVGSPISTTSLNLTGQAPCIDENEAKKFHQQYAPDCKFLNLNSLKPSGHSSSILLMKENGEFQFLREGFRVNEVKEHIKLLPA